MKNFKEIDVNQFLVKVMSQEPDVEKIFGLLKGIVTSPDDKTTSSINLILSHSETVEETFALITQIVGSLKNFGSMLPVMLQHGTTLNELKAGPVEHISDEDYVKIETSLSEVLKSIPSGTLTDFMLGYQKREEADWKGAMFFYFKLISHTAKI